MDKLITDQLNKMNVKCDSITAICSKDGVSVYRVACYDKSYVLKYFANESDRREIENYRILKSLEIPVLQIIAHTDYALLMEDIEQSDIYRLGITDDLNDTVVAKQIAKWYKQLHSKGQAFVRLYKGKLYNEADLITKENIEFIKVKTLTESNPVWDVVLGNFELIKACIMNAEKTLTYNDFYYTNLIVAKDISSSFMFDYNLLGKGYVYSDIRNVCSSLGEQAKAAFLDEYGDFNQDEIVIDNVASLLTTLYLACTRDVFPKWAEAYHEQVNNGTLLNAVNELIGFKTNDLIVHYDRLIDENNDPARDPKPLQEYMDKWDGQAFIDELQLSPDKTVLEIGVGTGRLALKVCGKCKHFVGIDISQKTINRARENITLICADFMDYDFESKFDAVYSSLTFIHIQDKQAAINRVANLLNPNGRFVLSIDDNQSTVLDMGNRKINLFPATADDISKYITTAGLQTEKQFETEFATIFVAVKE
jgi:2-polyprenyl-3-methyl-5-hydroxy-6-metoxy-1,4-benzoquinol methylase